MVSAVAVRIRDLEGEALADLQAAAGEAGGAMTIESGSVLTAESRARLDEAVRAVIHPEVRIGFNQEPDLVCGVRMRIQGQTLQWNVDDYLDGLRGETEALLDAATGDHLADAVNRR